MKDNFKLIVSYNITLTKEQYVLITKSLTGNLRPEEISIAKDFGLELMKYNNERLQARVDAGNHALELAKGK